MRQAPHRFARAFTQGDEKCDGRQGGCAADLGNEEADRWWRACEVASFTCTPLGGRARTSTTFVCGGRRLASGPSASRSYGHQARARARRSDGQDAAARADRVDLRRWLRPRRGGKWAGEHGNVTSRSPTPAADVLNEDEVADTALGPAALHRARTAAGGAQFLRARQVAGEGRLSADAGRRYATTATVGLVGMGRIGRGHRASRLEAFQVCRSSIIAASRNRTACRYKHYPGSSIDMARDVDAADGDRAGRRQRPRT